MAANEDTDGHAEAASDLEKKIIKQIEFYFGDKNLPRDRFLMEKADEDDGWITLDCLTTFNRLKALSTDPDAIAKALRKSDIGLIEVSEDNTKVRRVKSKPLPEDSLEARQDAKARTVYCKGFPTDISLDQLEEFFADKGKVIIISMRRNLEDRTFKGSVFVEFESAEEAKALVNQESLKYNDEELIKMMKYDYFKQLGEKRKDKQKEGDEKKEQKAEKQEKQENEEDGDDEEPLKYDTGCVLHFKNVGEQTSREDLKSLFGEHENIAWVNFTRGETEGFVRFSKEGGAQRAIDAVKAKNDGKVLIREVETTLRVLEGEEEKDFWKKSKEEREIAKQKKASKFRAGQRGRFGWGRGRGNRRGSDRDRPERKKGEGNDNETLKRTHTRFDDEEPTAKKVKAEED